jgi:hypothetical protein
MNFYITCDKKGIIKSIEKDEVLVFEVGISMFPFVDSSSVSKLLSFFLEIEKTNMAINWEITLLLEENLVLFNLTGVKKDDEIILIGFQSNINQEDYLSKMTLLSNEQHRLYRETMNLTRIENTIDDSDSIKKLQIEISDLKNKLIELRKELDVQLEENSKLNKSFEIKQQLFKQVKDEVYFYSVRLLGSTSLPTDLERDIRLILNSIEEI